MSSNRQSPAQHVDGLYFESLAFIDDDGSERMQPLLKPKVPPLDTETFERLIHAETMQIATQFPPQKRERGLTIPEMHRLTVAYANRVPIERSALLEALQMQPSEMASYFTIDPERPFLEEDDIIYRLSGSSATKELIDQNRSLILDCIDTTNPRLWVKIVGTLHGVSNKIHTLGDLSDADPDTITPRTGQRNMSLGVLQKQLCATVLQYYGLLTEQWEAHLPEEAAS